MSTVREELVALATSLSDARTNATHLVALVNSLCALSVGCDVAQFRTASSKIALKDYALRIADHLCCAPSTLVVAGCLVERLFRARPSCFGAGAQFKLVAAACAVAVKLNEDFYLHRPRLAAVLGLASRELGALEVLLCSLLGFRLFVSPEDAADTAERMAWLFSHCGAAAALHNPAHAFLRPSTSPPPSPPSPPSPPASLLPTQPPPPPPSTAPFGKRKCSSPSGDHTNGAVGKENMPVGGQGVGKVRRVRWSAAEDEALRRLVAECGSRWDDVAACMPHRTPASCQQRWRNKLRSQGGVSEAKR